MKATIMKLVVYSTFVAGTEINMLLNETNHWATHCRVNDNEAIYFVRMNKKACYKLFNLMNDDEGRLKVGLFSERFNTVYFFEKSEIESVYGHYFCEYTENRHPSLVYAIEKSLDVKLNKVTKQAHNARCLEILDLYVNNPDSGISVWGPEHRWEAKINAILKRSSYEPVATHLK